MMGDMERPSGREPIEYLLDDLTDEDRASFEARMRGDRELREEVSEVDSLFAALRSLPEDSWSADEPPPLALPIKGRDPRADEATVEEAPPVAPPRPVRRRGWLSGLRVPALATGALAVLLAGLAIGSQLGDEGATTPTSSPQQIVSSSELRPAGKAGSGSRGSARVIGADGGDQSLAVSVADMPATAPGRYYELWLMSGQGKLISVGGFKVGSAGARNVEVPLPVDPADYRLIDISLERVNGDPGHSAVSLLRGPV